MLTGITQPKFVRMGLAVLALLIASIVWLNPASAFLHGRGETSMSTDNQQTVLTSNFVKAL